MTALRRARPYLLIGLIVGLAFLLLARLPAQRVGDGAEYYAMFLAWTEGWRPWTTTASQAAYDALLASQKISAMVPREWFDASFGALRIGETTDFNHFWFYSLLAALCHTLAALVGVDLSPHASFLLLHAVLVAATVDAGWRAYRWRGAVVMGLLIVASPVVWYLDKVHTEVFTVCLLALGMLQMHRARYAAAALLFALASTQNPSFALVAGIPWAYRVLLQWRLPYRRIELLLLAGAAVTVVLHPAYYLLRYGVVTPQLLAGGAKLGANLDIFYIWIVDPDLGLLPNWPLGAAAVILGAVLWLRRALRPAGPVMARPDRLEAVFIVLYLLINFYAQSSTTNLNSGATPGLARYALWYLPLALPLLLWLAAQWRWRGWRAVAGGALCAALTVAAVQRCNPRQPEQYSKPSTLSYQLQYRLPGLYDPPAELFMERYSGAGEARSFDLVVGPDCRKMLLLGVVATPGSAAPAKCLYDLDQLNAYRRALGEITARYVHLNAAQAARLRLTVSPQPYRVGLGGTGNFALGGGWSKPEPWGVWSDGKKAKLFFPCDGQSFYSADQGFRVALQLKPFENQQLVVRAGGTTLWQGRLPASGAEVRLAIAPAICSNGVAQVTLDIANPTRPSDHGQSADHRRLGVALSGFQILGPMR